MNCQNCQSELEDFLYGELKPSRASQIRAHLMVCSFCSAARDELEHEHEIFTQYYEQTALEPAPELWDAIRSRLHTEPLPQKRINSRFKWGKFVWLSRPAVIRQTAFALLIILLTATATTYILRRDTDKDPNTNVVKVDPAVSPSPTRTVNPVVDQLKPDLPAPGIVQAKPPRLAPRSKPLTDEEIINRQIARTEREYQNAIRLLDQAIARRKDELDPGVIKQYEASLALIDNSIAASRLVLRDHPTDPAARQFLLTAYARKVDLMQDIAMR
ncbi:MAG: zf-HC2 domain-containing protein [Acidobacteria bacterium]|nr:zf-HC2 domain-containing protein [Acidobacteriota bacterium]